MQVQSYAKEIKDLISESSQILIITHKNPTPDGIASLLAFGQILEKLEKEHVMISPDPIPQELNFLKGSNRITQQMGPRKLIIGIKGGKEIIEKVSYFTQDDKFNLVITPRNKSLALDQIDYSFTGLSSDLLVALDTIKPEGLSSFSEEFSKELKELPLINIDRHSQNGQFGKINWVDNSCSSTAEIVLALAQKLEIEIDPDLATTLLTGIYGGSRDFRSLTTNAGSFKSAAMLMEKGADLGKILKNLSGQIQEGQKDSESGPDEGVGGQEEPGSKIDQSSEERGEIGASAQNEVVEENMDEENLSEPPITAWELEEDNSEESKI